MITFITGSEGKLREAQSILGDVVSIDIDLPEIQEINPQKVIEAKLNEALRHNKGEFIVEDTSLYFNDLNGLPGPLIKWFLKTIGNEGLYDIAKNLKSQGAVAKTVIGYSDLDGNISFFEGAIKGIITEPRGDKGFGFDPIFKPDGQDKTFAEMSPEEKNELSMRKLALTELKKVLQK